MRRKSALGMLAFFSAAGFALGAAACGKEAPLTVEGFDVLETLSVNVGGLVELEQPIVTDSKGNLLDCWTYVTDSDGNYVSANSGLFAADDLDGYTIVYVVRASDNTVFEKKTLVTVTGTGGSSNVETTLDVDYEQFVTVGEEITIDANCSDENATLEYAVKKVSTDEAVEVTDGTFTPQEKGVYEVKVSVAGQAVSYKYNVFAEAPLKEGEVEIFDDAWVEKETFIGGKRQDWQIVSSDESGLLNPYGRKATFAKYSTTRAYIPLFINIREENEYYKQLAADGYSYVSMWIYMQSQKPHITISDRDPNGGFYRREGPDLHPGEWVEFRLNLLTGKNTWVRSFTQCYPYYANQSHFYLQVDNSDEYNPWGGKDKITFYFTDIYAVKATEVSAVSGTNTALKTGESVTLSEFFTSETPLTYSVNYRGETVAVESETFEFPSNGTFEISATPKSFNLRGEASVTFDVTDDFSVSGSPIIKERTEGAATVSVSELNASFAESGGITPTIEGYNAYYGKESIALVDGAFTADKNGSYSVEVVGRYELNGKLYRTYQTLPVDVWSAESKYQVLNGEKLLYMSAYNSWDAHPTGTYGEHTVAGKTITGVKSVSRGQSNTVYGLPFYSKNYYEFLNAQGANAKLLMNLYIKDATSAKEKVRGLFWAYKKTTELATNEWHSVSIDLAKFIEEYDTVVNTYESYSAIVAAGGRSCPGTDNEQNATGALFYLYGGHHGREVYFELCVGYESEEATVALKDGKSLLLEQDNALNEVMDVTLDGVVGEITAAEVYFNEEWVALDNLSFNPVWAATYAFRFDLVTKDGSKYKTIETQFAVGGAAFEATKDETVYIVKAGETFDVANVLTGDYTFELETFASRGGNLTAVEVAEGTKLSANALEVGSYFINVYATKGDGAFGKILYYTLTVDYVGDYEKPVLLETPTADNYKKIFNSYQYAANQHLTDTIATTECPAGNSGSFIRYQGRDDNRKEALTYAIKPLFSKGYYNALLQSGKDYTVKFDVYLENLYEDCTRTHAYCYSWNTAGDKFTTHGLSLTLQEWHTVEIPLETLVKNLENDVKIFGVYIPYGGFKTADLMRMWIGNIRLEEVPPIWSAETLTKAMLKSYQYGSSQNLTDISIVTECPEGGVAGTYVKYTQTVSKEDIQLSVAPFFDKAYYQALVEGGTKYKVTYDVYVDVTTECECTVIQTKLWKDGGFKTHGSVSLGAWHTVEIDLQVLLDNWGNYRLFGLNFCNQNGLTRGTDMVEFWLGNIQLVEGEASGVPALKTTVNS